MSIGRRTLEGFLSDPSVVRRQDPSTLESWGRQAATARRDTEMRTDSFRLPSGEWVDRKRFEGLPSEEQDLLKTRGVEGFNQFMQENVRLEDGSWMLKATPEFKVLDALTEGYRTYGEITQVTGLSRSSIDRAVDNLKQRGLVT